MSTNLTVAMIDEDGREEWRGPATQLLADNSESVDVALAVLALEEGAPTADVGFYTLVRVA